MYSDKKNVLQLVALLKAHNITHIVLSPGSRNSPLIHSFATDNDFTCYSVVDERSAGFFALGIILATGQPAAVCCTSGTAALNLGPSMAEAFYQQLPLLAITADRSAAWIGQMDGQTIPQSNLFRDISRLSVQLPEITNQEEEWHCNRLINEAILSLDNGVKGPTHINIPLAEPLFGFNTATLPAVRKIRHSSQGYVIYDNDGYGERFAGYTKRMIIVGQLPPGNNLSVLLKQLQEKAGVVILTEQLSNIAIRDTSSFDTVLYAATEKDLEKLTPELIITVGGHIVSKRLKQFIRSTDIREHWHISPSGEITDTFQHVTDIVRSDYKTFLRYLTDLPTVAGNKTFGSLWKKACASISEPDVEFSDLEAVGALMHTLPENCSLHIGNSNSVRLSQLFDIPPSTKVFCNRGTNGIEGSLSSAVGYAAATNRPTFLLIGDLSFFFDLNGLWNKHKKQNLRILLNNNGGGEIFAVLPGLNKSEVLHDFISVAHTTDAKAWAEQQGFLYLSAHNKEELYRCLPFFTSIDIDMSHLPVENPSLTNDKPILLEVFTSMDLNTEQIQSYYRRQKEIFQAL